MKFKSNFLNLVNRDIATCLLLNALIFFYLGKQVDTNLNHKCSHFLSGVVLEEKSQYPLNKIGVLLFDKNNVFIKRVFTDRSGRFDFGSQICNNTYFIKTESKLYCAAEVTVVISSENEIFEQKIVLKLM